MPERCFLALTLPHAALGSLERAGAAFLERAPAWTGEKWVRRELLHVTLAFLGSLDDDTTAAIVGRMEDATRVPGFAIGLGSVVAVPSATRATMVWATPHDPEGGITALRARLLTACITVGEHPHPYRPHITLVRARRPRAVPLDGLRAATQVLCDSGKETDGVVSVLSVTLFSSTLTVAGPEYREIATTWLAH